MIRNRLKGKDDLDGVLIFTRRKKDPK